MWGNIDSDGELSTQQHIPENKEEFLKRWDALSEALAALPQDGLEIELPHQEQDRKEDEFKARRSKHYNEYAALMQYRERMAKEDADDAASMDVS